MSDGETGGEEPDAASAAAQTVQACADALLTATAAWVVAVGREPVSDTVLALAKRSLDDLFREAERTASVVVERMRDAARAAGDGAAGSGG